MLPAIAAEKWRRKQEEAVVRWSETDRQREMAKWQAAVQKRRQNAELEVVISHDEERTVTEQVGFEAAVRIHASGGNARPVDRPALNSTIPRPVPAPAAVASVYPTARYQPYDAPAPVRVVTGQPKPAPIPRRAGVGVGAVPARPAGFGAVRPQVVPQAKPQVVAQPQVVAKPQPVMKPQVVSSPRVAEKSNPAPEPKEANSSAPVAHSQRLRTAQAVKRIGVDALEALSTEELEAYARVLEVPADVLELEDKTFVAQKIVRKAHTFLTNSPAAGTAKPSLASPPPAPAPSVYQRPPLGSRAQPTLRHPPTKRVRCPLCDAINEVHATAPTSSCKACKGLFRC